MARETEPKCPNCGKEISEDELSCWHCETDLDSVKDKMQKPECFIATAVYGEHAIQTQLLRDYRDDYLQKNVFGRLFISFYYLVSPFIAKIIKRSVLLQTLIRKILNKLIQQLKK